MNKENNRILGIFIRYFVVILFGLGNLYLFYKILTPITINVFYFIVNLFTEAMLNVDIISFGDTLIEIVPACVAGAAYYLLFVLIMLTAMDLKTRIKAIVASLLTFFILNMIRLLILTLMIGLPNFELIHWIFWHLISTLFVVGIWFGIVKYLKIKGIPAYTDFIYLKNSNKSKRNNKHK